MNLQLGNNILNNIKANKSQNNVVGKEKGILSSRRRDVVEKYVAGASMPSYSINKKMSMNDERILNEKISNNYCTY